jgi:hypothetical protein
VEAFVDCEIVGSRHNLVREHVADCADCRYDAALLLAVRAALVRRVLSLPHPPA